MLINMICIGCKTNLSTKDIKIVKKTQSAAFKYLHFTCKHCGHKSYLKTEDKTYGPRLFNQIMESFYGNYEEHLRDHKKLLVDQAEDPNAYRRIKLKP